MASQWKVSVVTEEGTPNKAKMPGKGSRKRKGKKGSKRPPTTRAARPSVILASLHSPTTGEEATGGFWGGPGYGPESDSEESYRPQPDYGERYVEDQYSEVDSAGSYDPYMDCCEGYADYGGNRECSDVSLWSELGFDCVEDPSMEVEEVLYGDPPTDSDVEYAVSGSDEPPAPRILALPRRGCCGASKPSRATSFKEETPSTRAHSPGARAPVPKPRRGKVACAHPETKVTTPQISEGQSPTDGFVPVPITLSVPVAVWCPFVSVPVPVSVSFPVSVVVLVSVLPPSALLMLACVRSLGPLLLGPKLDKLACGESRRWGGALSRYGPSSQTSPHLLLIVCR
ncbi:hypothetical protein P4O66_008104 [Electrophorus voltai]|uniref:Uncharacterized protein n=1 Tax=Electrophorus voltai TaxID=2609070 RepID=A0AAD8ZGV1_9TELE|nr:hypothetical protein P4O66_008104 [Electrophorus voltai]